MKLFPHGIASRLENSELCQRVVHGIQKQQLRSQRRASIRGSNGMLNATAAASSASLGVTLEPEEVSPRTKETEGYSSQNIDGTNETGTGT